MNKVSVFLGFWALNSLLLYLAANVWQGFVVLGNSSLTSLPAAILSGLLVTTAVWLVEPTIKKLDLKIKDDWMQGLIYWLVNAAAIWLIAKAAQVTGLGILYFWVAIVLGFVLNLAQYVVWKMSSAVREKKGAS